MMKIDINMVTTNKDYKLCLEIRRKVFVQEQNIDENLENDDHIINASYIIAFKELLPVGTARYRRTNFGIKLERFAVLKEFRCLGVGKSLLKFLLNKLSKEKKIYLNSQEKVVNFYEKSGFKKFGKIFYEAAVPHYKMIYIK